MKKTRVPHYIIWLHGGLGNQLFQWAMATALAQRHNGLAWGDRSYLAQDTLRSYSLDQFAINFPEPTEDIVEKIIGRPRYMDTPGDRRPAIVRKIYNLRQSLLPWYRRDRVQEPSMIFEPRLASRNTSAYLDGFWQNEHYFSDCADTIRPNLKLRVAPSPRWFEWETTILKQESIGVHIRRGDYISNDFVTKNIGPCSLDYYERGVRHHNTDSHKKPVYLFTDDPAWARQQFQDKDWHIVSGSGAWNDAAEMTLLSRCSHFVLSNSSFSWWAAWIANVRPDNIIVPIPWFSEPTKHHIHPAPQGWLRLPK